MNSKKETECPYCHSIKVIELPASFTSSVEMEMLGSEQKDVEHTIYRCLVCRREFEEREK